MAQVRDLVVNGSANVIGTIYGNLVGNASTASTLATARTIRTNLGSTSTASFNGSANITPGVTGTLPIANGGTGATSAAAALTAFGLTATATELNYCDGVTSNIQTQLNNKMSSRPTCIEFGGSADSSVNEGFIDFHFNGSNADYTSRIIEGASGQLSINGIVMKNSGDIVCGSCTFMKIVSQSSAPTGASHIVWYDTTNKVMKFWVNGAWQGMNTYQ